MIKTGLFPIFAVPPESTTIFTKIYLLMHEEPDLKRFICDQLKKLRKEKKYTQQQVAELIHMSQNAYSELESGKRRMDIDRLQQIAKIFNAPVNYFFTMPEKSRKRTIKINRK